MEKIRPPEPETCSRCNELLEALSSDYFTFKRERLVYCSKASKGVVLAVAEQMLHSDSLVGPGVTKWHNTVIVECLG